MRTVSDLEITCFVSIDALRGVSSVSSLLLTWRAGFQEKNMETYMFERKMDNCKPCGGAIPLCMVRGEALICALVVHLPVHREG